TQVESYLGLFLRCGAQMTNLRSVSAGKLARERYISLRCLLGGWTRKCTLVFPRGSRAFERHDILHRHLIEAGALTRALQQIEQSEPRQRRVLGFLVFGQSALEQQSRLLELATGVHQRGILEDRAQNGIGLWSMDVLVQPLRPIHQAR